MHRCGASKEGVDESACLAAHPHDVSNGRFFIDAGKCSGILYTYIKITQVFLDRYIYTHTDNTLLVSTWPLMLQFTTIFRTDRTLAFELIRDRGTPCA